MEEGPSEEVQVQAIVDFSRAGSARYSTERHKNKGDDVKPCFWDEKISAWPSVYKGLPEFAALGRFPGLKRISHREQKNPGKRWFQPGLWSVDGLHHQVMGILGLLSRLGLSHSVSHHSTALESQEDYYFIFYAHLKFKSRKK